MVDAFDELEHGRCAEGVAGPDDTSGLVDIKAVFQRAEECHPRSPVRGLVGGHNGVRGDPAGVQAGERRVDESDLAESNLELAVAAVCGFFGYMVGVCCVVYLDSTTAVVLRARGGRSGGFVDAGLTAGRLGALDLRLLGSCGARSDETDGSTAVAVLWSDDDDAVGGNGAADVGVGETGATETVGEYHSRKPEARRRGGE